MGLRDDDQYYEYEQLPQQPDHDTPAHAEPPAEPQDADNGQRSGMGSRPLVGAGDDEPSTTLMPTLRHDDSLDDSPTTPHVARRGVEGERAPRRAAGHPYPPLA